MRPARRVTPARPGPRVNRDLPVSPDPSVQLALRATRDLLGSLAQRAPLVPRVNKVHPVSLGRRARLGHKVSRDLPGSRARQDLLVHKDQPVQLALRASRDPPG